MQASVSDQVDLHGGVTTGVVDGAGVNLGNGHFQSCCRQKPVLVSKNIVAVAEVSTVKLGNGQSRAIAAHFLTGAIL